MSFWSFIFDIFIAIITNPINAAVTAYSYYSMYVTYRTITMGTQMPNVKMGRNNIEYPTADEDRTVTEVFGTCLIFPNMVWAGSVSSSALKAKD